MDPNEGWHFGLQFPICISPCLQRFTVLRTVYSIRVNQARTEADIFSTSLSFEPGSNMATQWSVEDTLSHKTVNEFAVWRGDCHQFLYSLVFAPDGHRLLLMGTDPTGVWISLAVFRLENSGYTSAFLAGSMDIEKTAHGFNWSPKNAIQAFHPDYPLVAYTIADMDYHNVYLWMYDIKYHKDPRLRSSSWHCHRTPGKYEKLTFSEDGRFLVLNHTFVREPAVVAIPKKIMKACKMSKNDGPAFESAVLKEKGPIIGSAVYDVGPKKQVKGISAHSVDGKIELRLWDENNQFSTASNVEITRLPDSWTSLRSTSASFCLPSSEDERLKIALVKCRPDAWNYMSVEENQKKDVHLPAVISRDISRLRLGNEAVVDVQSFLESANSTTNSEEQNNDDGNGVGSSGAQNPNNSQKERHTVVFFKGGVATPIG